MFSRPMAPRFQRLTLDNHMILNLSTVYIFYLQILGSLDLNIFVYWVFLFITIVLTLYIAN